ncbi:hypothetical protein [Mucilaginibacter glaciei]|uniref:Uncharacterized protein n=1 Tax=Mucilaginibacter glaciei TaxID=2772109 RepID=A0A926NMW2_9SPHI|nr:hypothetical protein [Mucilaginibacter glaciei]MBD1392133.1 hypothetical protein [Mucilaginibacter glaciei]
MSIDNEDKKPTAYQVDDDSNLEQKDLERNFLFGKSEEKSANEPDMEAEGTGGQRFGENNNTPSGDDKNNPSQNAGYSNAYFSRTEPSEEHPENSNFKDPNQSGQSNYTQANEATKTGASDSENTDNEAQKQPEQSYVEGTADGKDTNIPGPNELPDQQKVGD